MSVGSGPIQQYAPVQPPVVVDIDLTDVPDVVFTDQVISDGTNTYTLGLENDYLLAEFAEWASEGSVYNLYFDFFETTIKSGTDANGVAINEPFKALWAKVEAKEISFRKLTQAAEQVITTWTEQLTDTSMRPSRRNRASRRASQRKR